MGEKIYYPELDSLRFFAFLAVFIHHAPSLAGIPGYEIFHSQGWAGVDLFLCLSAFLFVHLLRTEWQKTGKINIAFFYLRRSLRIWPVYFIYLVLVFLFIYLTQGHSDRRLLYFYSAGTFTGNILDAFLGYPPTALLTALWTISYEEQFYAAIPWFLRIMFQKAKKQQFYILMAIFLVGLITRSLFILFKVAFPAIYVLPITHFESILFGMCLGLGIFDPIFKRLSWWAAGLLGLLSLYLTTIMPDYKLDTWWLMILYPLIGLGTSLLVYMALCSSGSKAMRWTSWRPLVYLGKISYGLYLYHQAGLKVTRWIISQAALYGLHLNEVVNNYLLFMLALGLTILIAMLSYKMIEKPFLQMKARFTVIQSRPV